MLWYKSLLYASPEERSRYTISLAGIHWRELDTDVSFESFSYPEAEPSAFQRFFLSHPEINIAGFAKRSGINATLLRNYINGFKNPSPAASERILKSLHALGQEFLDADF